MKSRYKIIPFLFATLFIMSCGNKAKEETAVAEEQKVDLNTVEITANQYKTAEVAIGTIEEKALSGTTKVSEC